jgi:hypothetical protein
MDDEMNFVRVLPQLHFDSFRTAMLDGVVQSFLQNPQEANSDFVRQDTRNFTCEVDLQSLPLGKFLAPAFQTLNDTEIFQS